MKKLLAVVLAGLAFSASANGADRITVGPGENCPAGTAATVPSYHWEDGRFVRDGWLCESIYRDSRGG